MTAAPARRPLNSIHNAGLPWELGLAEAHQTLILNGLRCRVVLEADGKLMTGGTWPSPPLLGAEEFGFATALLVPGLRHDACLQPGHLPHGHRHPEPRAAQRFKGKPEYVMNFMGSWPRSCGRYGQAGRPHRGGAGGPHRPAEGQGGHHPPGGPDGPEPLLQNPWHEHGNVHFDPKDAYDFHLERPLDMKVLMKSCSLKKGSPQSVKLRSPPPTEPSAPCSAARSPAGRQHPAGRHLRDHLPRRRRPVLRRVYPQGADLELEGDCNDYMGKGLSGGKIIVRPRRHTLTPARTSSGNVALYGATGGKAFINGWPASASASATPAPACGEGVGDHGCEYMTGGTVVV